MNLIYDRDIPDAPNNPSVDQPKMRVNTNSADTLWTLDHFGFNNDQGGYHNVIHQPNQVGGVDPTPITIPNPINQIYVKDYTPPAMGGVPETQLFNITSLGEISQLTGFSTTDADDGWQWIGGVLVQWGFVSFTTTPGTKSGTVTFLDRKPGSVMIPFPNNCFEVYATLSSSAGAPPLVGGSAISIPTSQVNNLTFEWLVFSVGGYNGFSWLAIGN